MKRKGILIMMIITLVMTACKKKGCTDPTAINYNSSAQKDDGSCEYSPQGTAPTVLSCQAFSNAGTTYELQDLGLAVDYIVECKMNVACDLKIMPGVTIEFTTDSGLKVSDAGSLNAVATVDAPIVFTGVDKAAGAWAGLYIDSEDVKNKISGCKIEFAGGDAFNSNGDEGAIILYASCKAEVSNNTIVNSATYGINSNYTGGDFIFNNNTISGCNLPMFSSATYIGSISGGTFTGNTTDVIYIDTYGGDGFILTNQTWSNLGVPYRIKGGGDVQSKSDWVVAPGVTIEVSQGAKILINDGFSMKAVGTASQPIKFKGTISSAGAWENIKFYGTNLLNEIGFAEISNGGENPTSTKGSVYLYYNAKLNIHDVVFNDNAACGVYGRLLSSQTVNPNYSSSNLTFVNTPCSENFEF